MKRRRSKLHRVAAEICESRLLMSTYTVNTLADPAAAQPGLLTLRQAVADANAHGGSNTINFSSSLFHTSAQQTINLSQGQLTLLNTTGTTTIDGPGQALLAIDAYERSRIFDISTQVTAVINGLKITGGAVTSPASQLAAGGGIENEGTLTLQESTVSGCTATAGSGLDRYVAGGTAMGGGIYSDGPLTLTNCIVSKNSTDGGYSQYLSCGDADGGGVYCTAPLTITGSIVVGNNASGGAYSSLGDSSDGDGGNAFGGGIFAKDTAIVVTSNISNNHCFGGGVGNGGVAGGGGLYLSGSSQLNQDVLSDNRAVGGVSFTAYVCISGNAMGGAIDAASVLSISSSTITGNTADGGVGNSEDYGPAGNAYGGGVAAAGSLTITESYVISNSATGGEPGGGGDSPNPDGANASGGGIYAMIGATVSKCTISYNAAQGADGGYVDAGNGGSAQGGGITLIAGDSNIDDSTLADNQAIGGIATTGFNQAGLAVYTSGDGRGGGVYNAGELNVLGSTFNGNDATGSPGPIPGEYYGENYDPGNGGDGLGAGLFSTGQLAVQDSTITANLATGGRGGDNDDANDGINGANGGNGEGGGVFSTLPVSSVNNTITGNTAIAGTGGAPVTEGSVVGVPGTPGVSQGGGIFAAKNSVLDNSVLSANVAASGADVYSSLSQASSNNLIGYGGGLTNGVNGNKIGIHNPQLLPLGYYGGPTQTLLPMPGSPVIGGGNVSLIPSGITTDQRGDPRTLNGKVDIGAVEFGDTTLTGTVFNDGNADGKRQTNDPGASGFTVYLDLNHDGQLDATDYSTTTNAAGQYSFVGLFPGTYSVVIEPLKNWRATTPTTFAIKAAAGTSTVPSFGQTQDALISGSVINAKTNKPLANFRVYLDLTDTGKFVSSDPSVITSSTGAWSFTISTPGTYYVRIVPMSEFKTVSPAGDLFTFSLGKASARIGNIFSEQAVG